MIYKLKFLPSALKEWKKLPSPIMQQFKKKLAERQLHPHVRASQLRSAKNVYKIKLKSSGFRLVYEVCDSELFVYVIAVGKRDRNSVYKHAMGRLH